MREYRVLTQTDSFWSDRFSPKVLEETLNQLAVDGWRAISIGTTDFTGLGGLGTKRHELFVVLERERTSEDLRREQASLAEARRYDPRLIPAEKYYAAVGDAEELLVRKGLLKAEQVAEARDEANRRGGHICDHVLALRLLPDAVMREALGFPAEFLG